MDYNLKEIWNVIMDLAMKTDENEYSDDYTFWDTIINQGIIDYLDTKGVDGFEEYDLVDEITDEIKMEYEPV